MKDGLIRRCPDPLKLPRRICRSVGRRIRERFHGAGTATRRVELLEHLAAHPTDTAHVAEPNTHMIELNLERCVSPSQPHGGGASCAAADEEEVGP